MKTDLQEFGQIIVGMRTAYASGENAMAWARANCTHNNNTIDTTLIAYDLQAGSYVAGARRNSQYRLKWCGQLAELLRPYIEPGDRILEVGVGEATTLTGVTQLIQRQDVYAFGFDVSWSRIKVAKQWATEKSVVANLFVGDLFRIPMADESIDVVYSAHSLEPNGGREKEAIAELLRVARKAVVLVEPIYELASAEAQQRMAAHGYVRGLKQVAEQLGVRVAEYGLLPISDNPLNPSGVVVLTKPRSESEKNKSAGIELWQCPLTATGMVNLEDIFFAEQVGIAYPVLRGIPLLRAEHAVVASKIL